MSWMSLTAKFIFKLMFIDIFNSLIQRAKVKATASYASIQICVICCRQSGRQVLQDYRKKGYKIRLYSLSNILACFICKLPRPFRLAQIINQYYIYCKLRMDTNYSFSGMTLTEIFEIQPLQSLFIKFWYLGLTSQLIISPQDANIFKAIRKNVTFANCFTFEMPIRTYINYIDKILQALATIDPKKTFQILLGHLRNNKVLSVSFELFGVAFLQLFGRILELLNTQMMNKILRKIFYEITVINKMGVSTLKAKGIRSISFEELIPNFNDLLEQKANNNQLGTSSKLNPQQVSIHHGQRNRSTTERQYDIKTIKGRLQAQRDHNYQLRQSQGEHYPIGERIRNKQRASISCYMMGGFQIVDYSDSINQLHKKLLTKILLNK